MVGGMKFSPYPIVKEDYNKLHDFCSLNFFKRVNPSQIPISLPSELIDKSIGAVIVGSGDMKNAVYMINFSRADRSVYAVDQEPFLVAYHSGDVSISLTAGFVHHGNWQGRTIYPGAGFFQTITRSGIMNYYPYLGMPEKEYGSITELTPDSQRLAFWNAVRMIKND